MNNFHYDFENTGYKIHLPVVPDTNDPLTKKIAAYLDDLYGTSETDRFGFKDMGGGRQGCYSKYFKIGNCSDALEDGKGITIYGKTSTMNEMEALAKDIEARFGKELSNNISVHNIIPTCLDRPITKNITTRFAGYHFGISDPINGKQKVFMDYNHAMNPSGALTKKVFKDIKGDFYELAPFHLKTLSDIDKKFVFGDSTLAMIDNFGELFTGKVENGRVPQFVMDGLPKEYLQHYNLSEQDVIKRINNGTRQIVANMLEDVVNNPKSKILAGNPPWFTTLEVQVIDEAKQLLAQYEPQTVQKLEQLLPQLEQKCAALSVLKQTTPFAQIKLQPPVKPIEGNPVNPHAPNKNGSQNPVNPNQKPQTTSKPNANVGKNSPKAGWFEKLGKKEKIGLAVAGTSLVVGTIYALSHYNSTKKNEVVTTNTSENLLTKPVQPMRSQQSPCNTNFYGCYKNPCFNCVK